MSVCEEWEGKGDQAENSGGVARMRARSRSKQLAASRVLGWAGPNTRRSDDSVACCICSDSITPNSLIDLVAATSG